MSVAARIERGYYEDLVRVIDADDHYNRLGDFVREAVLEKIDRWKRTPWVLHRLEGEVG